MAHKIIFKPQAKEDIDEIFDYLAQEGGLDIAIRFETGVIDTTKTLAKFPEMGVQRLYGNDAELELRMLPITDIQTYLLFYTPNKTEIIVLRVIHGSRDMKNQF